MKYLKKFNESNEPINEGVGTFLLSLYVSYKIAKWINGIINKSEAKRRNVINRNYVSNILELISLGKTNVGDSIKVSELNDRYYIIMNGIFSKIPNFRILKKEKQLIIDDKFDSKIDLTESEYNDFLSIIKSKL